MDTARTPLSEAEFEEIMNRNRAISSSAISRAVSDASAGLYISSCFIYLFLERGEGKEKDIVWLPLAHPPLGIWPTTQAYALTGN